MEDVSLVKSYMLEVLLVLNPGPSILVGRSEMVGNVPVEAYGNRPVCIEMN